MKAGEIIDRIKKNLGAPWRDATYRDTFKTGGPETEVTGIATTCFVTLDVIRKASAAGLNMIIPHEGTFWSDRDDQAIVADDALYKEKLALITKHNVVVFRIHDHMHVQRPDFTYVGSARAIGLDPTHEDPPGSHRFVIPETTLGALAADVQRRCGARALRVVGDPRARVSRVRLGVGYATPPISPPDVDVLDQRRAAGERTAPSTVRPYALDAVPRSASPRASILLGHTIVGGTAGHARDGPAGSKGVRPGDSGAARESRRAAVGARGPLESRAFLAVLPLSGRSFAPGARGSERPAP